MKHFIIQCEILKAIGIQEYGVIADNTAEAIKKFNAGDYEFIGEDFEVTEQGEPQIICSVIVD